MKKRFQKFLAMFASGTLVIGIMIGIVGTSIYFRKSPDPVLSLTLFFLALLGAFFLMFAPGPSPD